MQPLVGGGWGTRGDITSVALVFRPCALGFIRRGAAFGCELRVGRGHSSRASADFRADNCRHWGAQVL